MKISMDKKYRTRDGQDVRILCVDRPHSCYPVVGLVGDILSTWGAQGMHGNKEGSSTDLVEVSPYEDFKMDDPVMVRDDVYEPWIKRHFKEVSPEEGVYCWNQGKTSWTTHEFIHWNQCRRPTPEELK